MRSSARCCVSRWPTPTTRGIACYSIRFTTSCRAQVSSAPTTINLPGLAARFTKPNARSWRRSTHSRWRWTPAWPNRSASIRRRMRCWRGIRIRNHSMGTSNLRRVWIIGRSRHTKAGPTPCHCECWTRRVNRCRSKVCPWKTRLNPPIGSGANASSSLWNYRRWGGACSSSVGLKEPSNQPHRTGRHEGESPTEFTGCKRGAARPAVQIFRRGKKVLGGAGLSVIVVKDTWGSWGGPDAIEAKSLSEVLERWRVTQVETIESGPERAALWVRFAGQRSRIELTFQLYRGRDAVDVSARVLWNERQARLKLVMPVGARTAEFEVPGARIRREPCGEVPGGRWLRTRNFGFASDALYCFDCRNGELRATVVRASGYALSATNQPQSDAVASRLRPWRPAVDCGELRFRFLINPGNDELPVLAQWLEQPPVSLVVPAKAGKLPRIGSVAALRPASLQMLALKKAEDAKGLVLRVQETSGKATSGALTWCGQKLGLGTVRAGTIASWRLQLRRGRWTVKRTSIVET